MKKLFLLFAWTSLFSTANAQKLPDVQKGTLRAPVNIKIDGKPDEWNNQFQAYNKNTEIFYTISNDNNNLYLTVKATDLDIINKIICGGITLTVNSSTEKQKLGGMSITFPVIDLNYAKQYLPLRIRLTTGIPINLDRPENITVETFIAELNKEITSKSKDVVVEKINGIKDTISIYNTEGIKAAIQVDNKTSMTYELALPLKSFGFSVDDRESFDYNIKLSGMNPDLNNRADLGQTFQAQRKALRYSVGNHPIGTALAEGNPGALRVINLASPTYFSGEYTLAK